MTRWHSPLLILPRVGISMYHSCQTFNRESSTTSHYENVWYVFRGQVTCLSTRPLKSKALQWQCDEGRTRVARRPLNFSGGSEGVCGLVADGYNYPMTFGGQPKLITVDRRDGLLVSSSWKIHVAARQLRKESALILQRTAFWGTYERQMDGLGRLLIASASVSPRLGPNYYSPRSCKQFCHSLNGFPLGCSLGDKTHLLGQDSYLVDSASSHMLVSKIKPCMSKYKQLYGETANGSLNQLSFIW